MDLKKGEARYPLERRMVEGPRDNLGRVDPAARSRRRRLRGTWTVAKSHDEAAAMDREFWASVTPAERFLAAVELSLELYSSEDQDEAPSRLRGSPHGVRPLRG